MTTCGELRAKGKVAVVGAGPAGATLARLLQRRGFDVTVFERDASATSRPQGGSLDLRPKYGQRAVDAAGLADVFAAQSRSEASAFRMIDPTGKELPGGGGTHEEAGPEIDRGDLRLLLLESLAADTVKWGHRVTAVDQAADGRWSLAFDGRPGVTADLVVGADGVMSRVREKLSAERPRYIGMTMVATYIRKPLWRGSKIDAMLGEGSLMFIGGRHSIFVQRCNRDVILLYYSLTVPEDWPASDGFALDQPGRVMGKVRAEYAHWSPAVLDMLTEVDDSFHRWPMWVLPADHTRESRPGLTMIGDASHAMPPFTGKGVNLAMVDALEQVGALTADPGRAVADAVRTFEAGMQAQTWAQTGECMAVGNHIYGDSVSWD